MEQLRIEFGALRDAGKLPRDYSNKKYARKTWVDLIRIIDEDSPDEDRLEALKAIFCAVNRVGTDEKDEIVAYQLWNITKQLNSGDILLLRTFTQHGPPPWWAAIFPVASSSWRPSRGLGIVESGSASI